jgi:phage shock protein A
MGIFERASAALRANLSALLDQRGDPGAVLDDTLREMQEALVQGQRELVTTLGTAKRLDAEAEVQAQESVRWEERAMLAVRKADDTLARDALRQKARSLKESTRLSEQAGAARSAAERLRTTLAELEDKTRDLEARKNTLAAQVRAARATGSGSEAASASGAVSDLQRFGHRVDALEAEVEVASALGETQKVELEARFRKLEQQGGEQAMEDELAALKRKVEGG